MQNEVRWPIHQKPSWRPLAAVTPYFSSVREQETGPLNGSSVHAFSSWIDASNSSQSLHIIIIIWYLALRLSLRCVCVCVWRCVARIYLHANCTHKMCKCRIYFIFHLIRFISFWIFSFLFPFRFSFAKTSFDVHRSPVPIPYYYSPRNSDRTREGIERKRHNNKNVKNTRAQRKKVFATREKMCINFSNRH